MEINRLPASPNKGSVHRKIPSPFQRPSISIGGHPEDKLVKRDWQLIPAHRVREGDIVPGIGRISYTKEVSSAPPANSGLTAAEIVEAVSWTVTLAGGDDPSHKHLFQGNHQLYAFTAVE